MHGGGLDPSVVFVHDDQAFNAYILTIPDWVNIFFDPLNYHVSLHLKDRKVLEKYRGVPFPNYHKLKGILRCIESTMSKLPSSGGHEALSMVPAVEFHPPTHLPNQLPHSSSSDAFVYSDSTTSSAITPSKFPLTSETTLPPYVQPDLDYCYLPAPSIVSNTYFPSAWPGNQQISDSDQQNAHENQPAPVSSVYSSIQAAIQQSGPPLSSASFDAVQQLAGDRQLAGPVPAIPFLLLSRDPTTSSSSPTSSLPFGVQSTAPSSRSTAKRQRVDGASVFSGQSAPPETKPVETIARIMESVKALAKTIQQLPAPPLPPWTPDMLAAIKATNALSNNHSLSDQHKVLLRRHFCRNPVDAASLPDDDALLDTIFQDMLKRTDMQ